MMEFTHEENTKNKEMNEYYMITIENGISPAMNNLYLYYRERSESVVKLYMDLVNI
jgi:hypothetical protein